MLFGYHYASIYVPLNLVSFQEFITHYEIINVLICLIWPLILKVHNEREMDRVLGIAGIELIGINNRNLGIFTTLSLSISYKVPDCCLSVLFIFEKLIVLCLKMLFAHCLHVICSFSKIIFSKICSISGVPPCSTPGPVIMAHISLKHGHASPCMRWCPHVELHHNRACHTAVHTRIVI